MSRGGQQPAPKHRRRACADPDNFVLASGDRGDVDHFKAFNDTYGHQFGDEVLRAVAGAVRAVVRSTDVPARSGGEELAVVLPDTDLDGAFAAGEQIRRAVEAVRVEWPGGAPLRVTGSVAVAAGEPVIWEARTPRRDRRVLGMGSRRVPCASKCT